MSSLPRPLALRFVPLLSTLADAREQAHDLLDAFDALPAEERSERSEQVQKDLAALTYQMDAIGGLIHGQLPGAVASQVTEGVATPLMVG